MHAPRPQELVWWAKPIETLIPILRGSELEKEDDVEKEDEGIGGGRQAILNPRSGIGY